MKLWQTIHPTVMKRLHHMVFVGKFVKQDQTHFYIQCLSPVPSFLRELDSSEQPIFSGLLSNKHNDSFFSNTNNLEREQSLIMFRLQYGNQRLHVQILHTKKTIVANSYQIIPAPLLQRGQTRAVLDRKLANGYTSIFLPKYTSDFGMPEMLIKDGRLYGNLELKSSMSAMMFVEQKMEALYLDIENWSTYIEMQVDETLYFVSSATFHKLLKTVQEYGKKVMAEDNTVITYNGINEKEIQFLYNIKQLALERELYLDELDIYNFHICLKTSPITIVGGMPGIGKSKLAQIYGEALGLQYNKHFLLVPISPTIQEPQDLLGYLHPNGTYMESEHGIISFLLEAATHPEQLYMIVFDEMNLSIIEHWFTSFLSLLELEEEKRILHLYKTDAEISRVPSSVKIGRNIIFIGTVNFDETTKELSDRLLDRVNMVILKKLSFRESFLMKKDKKHVYNSISANEYREQWVCRRQFSMVFSEEELEFFDRLHTSLQKVDPTKGVSFRTVAAISTYLINIPIDDDHFPLLSREEALDIQVLQRILTKIRGVDTVVRPFVDEENRGQTSLLHLLQSPIAQEVSSFSSSISSLKQKAKELELFGYVK
ncbi:AAA family ATPase [Ectobacillus sp. sgz5001026]|uniref:AAA family ATPase n=1 Tax=Ectobacillus sp. sgz5001026 TaxID=3242473 RepID=UPI0036D3E624